MSAANRRTNHKCKPSCLPASLRVTVLLFLCSSFLPLLAFPQTRSLEILVPPGVIHQSDYTNNLSAMIADSSVNGATITVYWSDFDCGNSGCTAGGNSHLKYQYDITDTAFSPWEGSGNGKTINIVLQMISNGAGGSTCPSPSDVGSRGVPNIGNCAMPAWVWNMLGSSNYSDNCGGTNGNQRIPNYFSSAFQTAYQNAIVNLIDHYANSLAQFKGDYIRVALGHGGEILPSPQWGTTCLSQLKTWAGLPQTATSEQVVSAWINSWLEPMVNFMGGKKFNGKTTPMQIMGAITPMGTNGGCTGCEVPDTIAPVYVSNKMGFGSQGLEISDYYSTTGTADWIELFHTYAGQVPLELQTFGQSCPGGVAACDGGNFSCTVNGTQYNNQSSASCTGDLPTLLPFASQKSATIFEVYYQDWDLANVTQPPPAGYCTKPGGTTQYCNNNYGAATEDALDSF